MVCKFRGDILQKNHKIVHMEIPVKNMTIAKEFFEKVFGWKVTITGETYAFFKDTEEGVGGGFELSEREMKGEFMLYISTESIEDTLVSIEKSGGKTLEGKSKISDEHGFCATFEDPFGNILRLWSEK
ncbi:MAG: VOC family protein [Asgard group archaeon]|nr:VOC family protein [Asgard group archaeon]